MTGKSKEFTHLDFENYIKIERGYAIIPSPDEKYKTLPDIYARLCSVIYFACCIGEKSDRACISNSARNEALIRAALSEFIALDDFIYKTYGRRLWFNDHTNTDPIFHMLKLLRNYNIHISSSVIDSEPMQVRWLYEPEKILTMDKYFISNLNLESLARLDNAKKYLSQLPMMIDAFEEQQHMFGICTLIMKCTLVNTACLDVLLPHRNK